MIWNVEVKVISNSYIEAAEGFRKTIVGFVLVLLTAVIPWSHDYDCHPTNVIHILMLLLFS